MPKTIVVTNNKDQGLITTYTVQPKNTLYSICKNYQITLNLLEDANPVSMLPAINPGDTLVIPFNINLVQKTVSDEYMEGFTPVFYKTAPKDNLFRIARIYFDQKIDLLMERNHLHNFDLKPGQLILIGWVKNDAPTVETEKIQIIQPQVREDSPVELIDEEQESNDKAEDKSIEIEHHEETDSIPTQPKSEISVSQNGLAIWNKNSRANGIFALHNEARIGSFLEIHNPQLNRIALIKVIGRIPDNSYPDNVRVIISPDAAHILGALDQRFYVRMNYIKE